MQNELSVPQVIRISDCDASGRLRPSALLVDTQELAEVHAASFGLSRVSLVENGMAWILYRQRIVMHRYPTFGDRVTITTWPGAIEGPLFPRHYLLEAEDGTRLAELSTSWILMNIQTRRPMRPSALPGSVPANLTREAPMPLPGMLRVAGAEPLLERTVRYSDVDVNGHMNNTKYIDWICDALDLDTLQRRGLAEWQLNYISEAKPGETLQLSSREDGESILFVGNRMTDGQTVFEASVTLGPEA